MKSSIISLRFSKEQKSNNRWRRVHVELGQSWLLFNRILSVSCRCGWGLWRKFFYFINFREILRGNLSWRNNPPPHSFTIKVPHQNLQPAPDLILSKNLSSSPSLNDQNQFASMHTSRASQKTATANVITLNQITAIEQFFYFYVLLSGARLEIDSSITYLCDFYQRSSLYPVNQSLRETWSDEHKRRDFFLRLCSCSTPA